MTLEAVHIAGGYANKAETDRRLLKRLMNGRVGIITGLAVTPKAASLGVDITAGEAVVTGRSTTSQGNYYVTDAAAGSIVWPAPSAQPRIDALVLAVGDTQYGALGAGMGGTVGPKWIVVQGAPNAAPVAPTDAAITTAVGAGGWERFADVAVNPGDTAFVAGDITSKVAALGAWTPYTPATTNLGNPTLGRCRYTEDGNTVHAQASLTMNGVAAGNIEITLPVPFHASYGASRDAIGTAVMSDVSTGQTYLAFVYPNPGGAGNKVLIRSHGNNDVWRADLPAVWAAGDLLTMSVTYEKA